MGNRGEQMSDDFGTVNVRRGDRAREIEVLRQHYRGHRDALSRLVADAPTEQLAGEYQRLITNIDEAPSCERVRAGAPPAMIPCTISGSLPKVGGHSLASSTPSRPDVPAPT